MNQELGQRYGSVCRCAVSPCNDALHFPPLTVERQMPRLTVKCVPLCHSQAAWRRRARRPRPGQRKKPTTKGESDLATLRAPGRTQKRASHTLACLGVFGKLSMGPKPLLQGSRPQGVLRQWLDLTRLLSFRNAAAA